MIFEFFDFFLWFLSFISNFLWEFFWYRGAGLNKFFMNINELENAYNGLSKSSCGWMNKVKFDALNE